MENNYECFLGQLTLYYYDKNKIKCDYSVIPISINCNNLTAKSEVSEEIIELKNYSFIKEFKEMICDGICREKDFRCIGEEFSKKKEGKAKKVSAIYKIADLEKNEDSIRKDLIEKFNKHFFFATKYKKFINKKITLKQL